eukprot:6651010-Pyramimonas_sp.AAC.1
MRRRDRTRRTHARKYQIAELDLWKDMVMLRQRGLGQRTFEHFQFQNHSQSGQRSVSRHKAANPDSRSAHQDRVDDVT